MKSYHENQVKNVNLDKPGTTPGALTSPHAPFGDPSAVSRGALALFRLIERLARRLGYAHVRIAPSELRPGKSLSEMLEKCARHIRRLLSELIALGWKSVLVVDHTVDQGFLQASRNIIGVNVLPTVGANVYDILAHDVLAITTAGVEGLKARLGGAAPSNAAEGAQS